MEYNRIKKVDELSGMIRVILDTCFEKNDYFLSDMDKKCLKSFREKIFDIGINNIEELEQFEKVLKIIIKISIFSIKGRMQDTKFIEELFPISYIINKLEEHIEKLYLSKEKLDAQQIKKLNDIMVLLINANPNITPTIENTIQFLENIKVDISKTKFMEVFIQRFTEGRFMIQDENSDKRFNLAYEYIDLSTQQKEFYLFNNQGVSDLLQITKRVPKEKSKKILDIINQNLGLININIDEVNARVRQFITSNYNNVITNKEDFEKFLKDIQTIKLCQNLDLDLEILKMILMQFIMDNSVVSQNKREYFELLQRVIEEFSANDLKKYEIPGCCFFRCDYAQRNSAGQMIPSLFINILNTKSVELLIENRNLEVLEHIYHENTHQIQYLDLNLLQNLSRNDLRVLQLKEEIIKNFNPEYYIANYHMMFQEIEARERGARKLLELLESLNINNFENLREELRNKIYAEKANYKPARYKKKSINSTDTINVDQYFTEIIKSHPEILSKYPVVLSFLEQYD